MQKWEYLIVIPDEPSSKPRWVRGKELPNWENGPAIDDFLDFLGEQGWEMVAAPYTHLGYQYVKDFDSYEGKYPGEQATVIKQFEFFDSLRRRFVFKRPKP